MGPCGAVGRREDMVGTAPPAPLRAAQEAPLQETAQGGPVPSPEEAASPGVSTGEGSPEARV